MDLPRSEIGSVHGCAPIVGYPCPDPFALFVRLSVAVVADVRGNVRKGKEEKKIGLHYRPYVKRVTPFHPLMTSK